MGRPSLPGGLYAITDPALVLANKLLAQVTAAIDGGAAVIQYRDKSSDDATRMQQATALASLCVARKVPLIINDDVEMAKAVHANGVHLGITDDNVADARALLGNKAIIGVSCYNQLERAVAAVDAGADYVAFGRFFVSKSKPDAVTANLELLADARKQLQVPIVAIGGITPDNGGALVHAGADYLAAIHGVFGQADVFVAAESYAALFATSKR